MMPLRAWHNGPSTTRIFPRETANGRFEIGTITFGTIIRNVESMYTLNCGKVIVPIWRPFMFSPQWILRMSLHLKMWNWEWKVYWGSDLNPVHTYAVMYRFMSKLNKYKFICCGWYLHVQSRIDKMIFRSFRRPTRKLKSCGIHRNDMYINVHADCIITDIYDWNGHIYLDPTKRKAKWINITLYFERDTQ